MFHDINSSLFFFETDQAGELPIILKRGISLDWTNNIMTTTTCNNYYTNINHLEQLQTRIGTSGKHAAQHLQSTTQTTQTNNCN
jgi:hypothetical protein